MLNRISRSNRYDECYEIMKHLIRNTKYCPSSNKLFSGQLLSSPWNIIFRAHCLTFMYSIIIATIYACTAINTYICLDRFNLHI